MWPLCVLLGDALGGCLFLFLLFHHKYILLFPMLHRIMPDIHSIPSEDCLERGCLFHIYSSPVGILVGHR